MAKISILIANYNNGHFFTEAYNSLLRQTEQDWEAIVLDDKSTDDSLEIIKSLIGDDKRVMLHQNKENGGIGYTKSKLINLSTADIFGFLDPDDVLADNALEIMISEHQLNNDVGLVYSNKITCDDKLNVIRVERKSQLSTNDLLFFNLDNTINHFTTFKRKFYDRTSGLDPHMLLAEDHDLYLKMYDVAKVLHTDHDLYYYRLHKGGISTGGNSIKGLLNDQRTDYWHWRAIMNASQRRGVNSEDVFNNYFVRKQKHDYLIGALKRSKWYKLGQMFGFMKWVKKL